jgi:initiation factor 1A
MVRNKVGGNKSKKMGRKYLNAPQSRTLRMSKEDAEMYAVVDTMYGNGMCNVVCLDSKERLCIIRRKFKGRGKRDNMISLGSWVLVGLRDWEVIREGKKPKCDLLEVYNDNEKEQLLKRCKEDLTPLVNIMKTNGEQDNDGDVFEFVDDQTLVYQDLLDVSSNHKKSSSNNKSGGGSVQDDMEQDNGVIDIDEI